MSSKRLWIVLIASAALAGCTTWNTHYGDEDASFGEAPKYDAAIQTINPAPVYSADSAQPGSSGANGAAAVKRYRTGSVKETQSAQTTGGAGSSGSGMGSGGGPQ